MSTANEASPSNGGEHGLLPTVEEVLACQFSSWYSTFSSLPPNSLQRTNVTIKSKIIHDLPPGFREYLLSDGIQLPAGVETSGMLSNRCNRDDDDDDWSSDGEEATNDTEFSFPELNQEIQNAINALGGSVVPKLNWSTPKDAVWMNAASLKCQSPGDVYLLLKSSDFCAYDICHALEDIQQEESVHPPLQLVLRKWSNLYPSQELRCFVRNHKLIAISQRHHSQHFPHLARDKTMMRSFLTEFFDEIVDRQFAHGQIANYVFDVYIDKKERVWLLDFNVWGRRTDALLYEWSELVSMDNRIPEIRVVETEKQVRHDPLASYKAPIDTVHVASLTGGDQSQFQEFMDLCERPTVLEEELLKEELNNVD